MKLRDIVAMGVVGITSLGLIGSCKDEPKLSSQQETPDMRRDDNSVTLIGFGSFSGLVHHNGNYNSSDSAFAIEVSGREARELDECLSQLYPEQVKSGAIYSTLSEQNLYTLHVTSGTFADQNVSTLLQEAITSMGFELKRVRLDVGYGIKIF